MSADFITSRRLREITRLSTQTLWLDRRSGLLAKGERRPGVRGLTVTPTQARDYLRQKGLKHLIREAGL